MNSSMLKITNFILISFLIISLNGCGAFRMTDAREVSPDPDKRVEKNMNEGRGLRLSTLGKQGGNFQFASANPLWRASLDVLDFAPLVSANYSGGILITDWVTTENKNETYKITVKFLSNEIRPDGLDIVIHQKTCVENANCSINKLKTSVINDLKLKILKTAALYQKEDTAKLNEEFGEYKFVPSKK